MPEPFPPTRSRRHWFRFSLRSMLVLVGVFCMILAWLVVQLNWIRARKEAVNRLAGERWVMATSESTNPPPWSIRFLGDRGYADIVWWRRDALDAAIAEDLRRLFPEAKIRPMEFAQFEEYCDQHGSSRRAKTPQPRTPLR